MRARALLLALALCTAGWPGRTQTSALVADRIAVEADSLVAEGHVEITHGAARLTAGRVVYDRAADRLSIEGPIVLDDGAGGVLLASEAELDPDLRAGVLRSARLVLDRRLQIAAAEIARGGDRYTRLSRVTASSCQICNASDTPLWEIRARRVVRDELERQLYFDGAQLRVMGVPVFYLPRLRLPDPTLDRASGFLVPSIRTRSDLGTGLVVPYFVRIGDHADLTFAPYLSNATTTLEGRYRQEFPGGRLNFEGAISSDDLSGGGRRAYLFGDARIDLPREFTLSFGLEMASDDAYLLDYGYSETDRLESGVEIARVRDGQRIRAAAVAHRTLRAEDLGLERELPSRVLEFAVDDRLFQDPAWGEAWAGLDGYAVMRSSEEDARGRDVARLSAHLDWSAQHVLPLGIVFDGAARMAVDHYRIRQDSGFPSSLTRSTPAASVGIGWPMERHGEDGARHLLEPMAQLAWSRVEGDAAPNEDSTVVEFDEGNLFALSRFPGDDRREEGLRLNLGATWTRWDPDGWSLGATLGRILRFDATDQFGADTGLSGSASDWLIAAHYALGETLDVSSRSLMADNLEIVRSETRLSWLSDGASFAGTHLWRAAEPSENRFDDLNELTLDGGYRLAEDWTANGALRFDADAGEATRAGLGLTYENECMGLDLSLSRRFTSSTTVEPVTEFDFRIYLTGFGTGGDTRRPRSRCNG